MIKISPSVLAGDFSRLGEEAKRMEECGADMLHLDVMDGNFVPNITFGAPVIKAVRSHSDIIFDVHLMIDDPIRYIEDFANAGADIITVHVEACHDVSAVIDKIIACGCIPSLSVKPATEIEKVYPYLDRLGMVLIMTVEPGFGGQKFMENMTDKIRTLREYCAKNALYINIQVDGGISEKTIESAARAGANVFVAGSAVFGSDDAKTEIDKLRRLACEVYEY